MVIYLLKTFFSWFSSHKRELLRLFWIVLTVLIFFAVIYQFIKGWQTIKNYPWNWNIKSILLTFLFYSIGLLATASVWSAIITKISGKTNYIDNIKLYSLTNIAQRIPTPIPYIGARTEAYMKFGIARNVTLTGLSIEITVTIVSGALLALITFPFGINRNLGVTNLVNLVVLLPLLYFIIRPSVLTKILNKIFQKFNQDQIQIEIHSNDMIRWLVYFIFIWINNGVINLCVIKSIYPIELNDIFFILNSVAISGVISWLGQVFFLIPNIAARQLTLAYLLSFIIPWEVAVIVAVSARLLVLIFELFWVGIISIFSVRIFKKLKTIEE